MSFASSWEGLLSPNRLVQLQKSDHHGNRADSLYKHFFLSFLFLALEPDRLAVFFYLSRLISKQTRGSARSTGQPRGAMVKYQFAKNWSWCNEVKSASLITDKIIESVYRLDATPCSLGACK